MAAHGRFSTTLNHLLQDLQPDEVLHGASCRSSMMPFAIMQHCCYFLDLEYYAAVGYAVSGRAGHSAYTQERNCLRPEVCFQMRKTGTVYAARPERLIAHSVKTLSCIMPTSFLSASGTASLFLNTYCHSPATIQFFCVRRLSDCAAMNRSTAVNCFSFGRWRPSAAMGVSGYH